jgi:hypothetical protein
MSNYGPPGEPYRGQPREPWQGRGEHDPSGQPPQQWGGRNPWDDPPPHPPYGGPQPGYRSHTQPGYGDDLEGHEATHAHEAEGPEPAWSQRTPLPPPDGRRRRTAMIVVLVVLVLLVLGGGGTALYVLGRGEESTTKRSSPRASNPAPGQAAGPTATPKTGTPAPESSTDARFAKVGQCVMNEGAASQPRLVITKCGSRTYQVLARFNGATTGERDAKAKCSTVAGYTDWYFFNSELDVLDFVLCLKLR